MNKKIIYIALFALLVDVVSKILVDNTMNYMETIPVIMNFFSITKVYNTGASWSILSGYQFILIIITIIMLALLIYYQAKFTLNNRNVFAFGLLYGGIIGNLLDRILYGHVIDFFDFKIFGYDYPVFNFADIFIVIGIILLIIAIYKKEDINEVSSR